MNVVCYGGVGVVINWLAAGSCRWVHRAHVCVLRLMHAHTHTRMHSRRCAGLLLWGGLLYHVRM